MRKQVRSEAPPKLAENAERWNRQWVELRKSNPSARFQWYQVDAKSAREWILPDLRTMTQGHCSFCDSYPLEDKSAEPIEHFRPKSKPEFAMLAYTWENLYYCCELCQKTKREQWDELLLQPDVPSYSFERFFVFDYTTGEIRPNPAAAADDRGRAAVTITMYGLDVAPRRKYRRLELRRWQRSRNREIDSFAYRDYIELESDTR